MIHINSSQSSMFNRRPKSHIQTFVIISLFLCIIYVLYLNKSLEVRLKNVDVKAQRFQAQHHSLSSQLQVVYEDRSRLENTLQKEKSEHQKIKIELAHQKESHERIVKDLKQTNEDKMEAMVQERAKTKGELNQARKSLDEALTQKRVLTDEEEKRTKSLESDDKEKKDLEIENSRLQEQFKELSEQHRESEALKRNLNLQLDSAKNELHRFDGLKNAMHAVGVDVLKLDHKHFDEMDETQRMLLFSHFGGGLKNAKDLEEQRQQLKINSPVENQAPFVQQPKQQQQPPKLQQQQAKQQPKQQQQQQQQPKQQQNTGETAEEHVARRYSHNMQKDRNSIGEEKKLPLLNALKPPANPSSHNLNNLEVNTIAKEDVKSRMDNGDDQEQKRSLKDGKKEDIKAIEGNGNVNLDSFPDANGQNPPKIEEVDSHHNEEDKRKLKDEFGNPLDGEAAEKEIDLTDVDGENTKDEEKKRVGLAEPIIPAEGQTSVAPAVVNVDVKDEREAIEMLGEIQKKQKKLEEEQAKNMEKLVALRGKDTQMEGEISDDKKALKQTHLHEEAADAPVDQMLHPPAARIVEVEQQPVIDAPGVQGKKDAAKRTHKRGRDQNENEEEETEDFEKKADDFNVEDLGMNAYQEKDLHEDDARHKPEEAVRLRGRNVQKIL